MTFLPPQLAIPSNQPLLPFQQLQRAAAVSKGKSSEPDCSIDVHIGIFFDGTNNNMERDKEKVPDPNQRRHTNVVVLYDTYADTREYHYRIYLPGVGTIFKEVGDHTESKQGKSMARGGEARIYWAMIQVMNALHRAIYKKTPLIYNDEATKLVTGTSFLAGQGFLPLAASRRNGVFHELGRRLQAAIKGQRPRIRVANLSVFGFSRGAAEARAFCNWMVDLCESGDGGNAFYSVPLRFQFVGLFDTVASVGVANSAPVPNDGGFMGWADGTMELPACIERCVHLTAAHEIRKSFPLSTGRKSQCHVEEYIYPGSHSDVGGGYAPGEQGKGHKRNELLSQVPLIHMYKAAIVAGVPLMLEQELEKYGRNETIRDLKLDPKLIDSFNDYRRLGPGGGEIKKAMLEHQRLYWRWRLAVGKAFKSLASYQAASAQDQEDLAASESDFLRDVQIAEHDEAFLQEEKKHPVQGVLSDVGVATPMGYNPAAAKRPYLTEAEKAVLAERRDKTAVQASVADFFDRYLHDSDATFYLVGPVTAQEKKQLIDSVKRKQQEGKALNSFERRVAALQETKPGYLPVITDVDYADLLELEDSTTRTITHLMTCSRRESEGHVRERMIFDKS